MTIDDLCCLSVQDHDGSHIKGLIMNFLHNFYPSLLKIPGFLVEFITPIIKVSPSALICLGPSLLDWSMLGRAHITALCSNQSTLACTGSISCHYSYASK